MIISPPLLKTPQGSTSDEQWLANLMPFPNTGNFPVISHLGWHGGLHIEHTDTGATGEAVRAIADGTIVYYRESAVDYDAPPLNYNGPTHNGCIVIKHETEIGEGDDGKVVFFSIYLHLKQTFKPVGTSKVYRKEPIGTVGQCSNDNAMHIEIVCDDANLKKLVGRSDPTLDVSKDGRDKVVYGDMHFYLPAGAQFHAAEPAAHVLTPTTAAAYTSTEALYVTMRLEKGQCSMTTRREDPAGSGIYAIVGDAVNSPDYEYNLYKRATKLADACVAAHLPNAPAPSAMYELLRFGRVINTDNEQAIAPGAVPHWREVNYPGGKGWVDLNAAGVKKFSDADFPHWMGWTLIDDDATSDSQCNSPTVMKWLDADQDGKNTAGELMMALRDDKVQTRLARTICKFPTEWEKEEIDTRYGWLKQKSDLLEEPLTESEYAEFKAHLEALCFWEKAKARMEIDANHWHFHPREFIEQFRKCGWLSCNEITQLLPRTSYKYRLSPFHRNAVNLTWEVALSRVTLYQPQLNKIFRKYGLVSAIRKAHFLGQAYIETDIIRVMREIGNGRPNSLGNWPVPAMQYYTVFYGRGMMQLTWSGNYDAYGSYRSTSLPGNPSGHYLDHWGRINNTSSHYLANPNDGGVARTWFPKFDPELIADNPFEACDSAGWYWVSKDIGNHKKNINQVADRGITEDAIGRASVLVNGGGFGYFERQGYARYIHQYLSDIPPRSDNETIPIHRGNHVYNISVNYTHQKP